MIIENHILTRGYATRENIAFYDHSWNKFLSYTNIQQIPSISRNVLLEYKKSIQRNTKICLRKLPGILDYIGNISASPYTDHKI